MLLLDTHVWIWWLLDDDRLSKEEKKTLDNHASKKEIALSMASVWELEVLHRKEKVLLSLPLDEWLDKATSDSFCCILPIDKDIILAQRNLPKGFPDDPADRLIVATALHNEIPFATKDKTLQELGF